LPRKAGVAFVVALHKKRSDLPFIPRAGFFSFASVLWS